MTPQAPLKRVSLADLIGREVESKELKARIVHFDPVAETFTLDGYSKIYHDPMVFPYMTVGDLLRLYGIEVAFTAEELEKIREAKLTNQVAKKAADLEAAIREWLNKPEGRI